MARTKNHQLKARERAQEQVREALARLKEGNRKHPRRGKLRPLPALPE